MLFKYLAVVSLAHPIGDMNWEFYNCPNFGKVLEVSVSGDSRAECDYRYVVAFACPRHQTVVIKSLCQGSLVPVKQD